MDQLQRWVSTTVEIVWGIGDICNALMAFPNLIALILLSPVIVKLTKEYLGSVTK